MGECTGFRAQIEEVDVAMAFSPLSVRQQSDPSCERGILRKRVLGEVSKPEPSCRWDGPSSLALFAPLLTVTD